MCALFVGLNFNLDLLSSLSCNPTSKNHFSCVLLAMFFFLSFFLIYFALYLFDEMSTRSAHALISLLSMSLVLKISPIGFYWNIDNLISSHQSVCERHWNLPSDYVQTRVGTLNGSFVKQQKNLLRDCMVTENFHLYIYFKDIRR